MFHLQKAHLVIKFLKYNWWFKDMSRTIFTDLKKTCHLLPPLSWLLVVSKIDDDRFLSYCTHIISTKCAFSWWKSYGCDGCPSFKVMSSPGPVVVPIYLGHPLQPSECVLYFWNIVECWDKKSNKGNLINVFFFISRKNTTF